MINVGGVAELFVSVTVIVLNPGTSDTVWLKAPEPANAGSLLI